MAFQFVEEPVAQQENLMCINCSIYHSKQFLYTELITLHLGWFVVVVSILLSLERYLIYEGKRVDYVSGKLASDGTLTSTDSEWKRREEEPTITSFALKNISSLFQLSAEIDKRFASKSGTYNISFILIDLLLTLCLLHLVHVIFHYWQWWQRFGYSVCWWILIHWESCICWHLN